MWMPAIAGSVSVEEYLSGPAYERGECVDGQVVEHNGGANPRAKIPGKCFKRLDDHCEKTGAGQAAVEKGAMKHLADPRPTPKFLAVSLLLLAPAAFGGAAFAEDAVLRGGNLLSCETYSYRELIKAGNIDMLSAPAFYKEQGIPGISYNQLYFNRFDDDYVDQVKAAAAKAGRVVTSFIIEGNVVTADEAKRREQIEKDRQMLRVANRLGAPRVRINLGGTGKENADDTAGLDRAVAALKELLPLARQLNVKIGLENHGGVTKGADNVVKIIKATDPQWVGALVDFGNFPIAVKYDEVPKVAPFAFSTHVKVNVFDAAGEAAEYDFPRVLGMMKAVDYKGPLSIEYEGTGDPVVGVQKTKALILKYW